MTLLIECLPLPAPVYADQQMWEKIVLNLLSNAFKYTLQGTITVRMSQRHQQWKYLSRILALAFGWGTTTYIERFHRIKGAKGRTSEGSGIGLSLTHELVKLHGGTIRVSSTPGQGVHLPSHYLWVRPSPAGPHRRTTHPCFDCDGFPSLYSGSTWIAGGLDEPVNLIPDVVLNTVTSLPEGELIKQPRAFFCR